MYSFHLPIPVTFHLEYTCFTGGALGSHSIMYPRRLDEINASNGTTCNRSRGWSPVDLFSSKLAKIPWDVQDKSIQDQLAIGHTIISFPLQSLASEETVGVLGINIDASLVNC